MHLLSFLSAGHNLCRQVCDFDSHHLLYSDKVAERANNCNQKFGLGASLGQYVLFFSKNTTVARGEWV